jgi:hypothetical protein
VINIAENVAQTIFAKISTYRTFTLGEGSQKICGSAIIFEKKHRIRLRNEKTRVQISPEYKVFRENVAVLLRIK